MTPGYSGTPLARKLGIRPGALVLLVGAPAGFERTLAGLPEDARVVRRAARGSHDVILAFTTRRARLAQAFERLVPRLAQEGGLWACWPKQASGVATDLSDGAVRALGLATGLVDNKVCAVDDTWSGLRFVRRVADRRER